MAEIIAFYGSPGSGKTSIAFKSAMQTYLNTNDSEIIFLSPDIEVPSMGLLFPNYNPEDVFSLSSVLDNTTITDDTVLSNLITVKTMKNFGCLGFKAGETRYSFPEPTTDKINALFDALEDLAGYIFVDCTSDETDLISKKAMNTADIRVRVISPDIKGMTWLSSHKKKNEGNKDEKRNLDVVNANTNSFYLPVEEICSELEYIQSVLPYSAALGQQLLDGTMSKPLKDRRFLKRLQELTEKCMYYGNEKDEE